MHVTPLVQGQDEPLPVQFVPMKPFAPEQPGPSQVYLKENKFPWSKEVAHGVNFPLMEVMLLESLELSLFCKSVLQEMR